MFLLKNFYLDTTKGIDILSIGHEIRRVIREAKAESGLVTVAVPFAGACLIVMEKDEKKMEERKKSFKGDEFMAKSLTIPIDKGELVTHPWQDVFLIDYETSGRRREFKVQVQYDAPPPAKDAKEAKNKI